MDAFLTDEGGARLKRTEADPGKIDRAFAQSA